MSECVSLLPYNATEQERALECATARLAGFDVPVSDVWNPETCPEHVLPWLAWAFSVDEWSADWSLEQKRGSISKAVAVHQKKGTVKGVQDALSGLGYDVDLSEWFEKSPQGDPYTFSAIVYAEQIGIPNAQEYASIEAVLNSSKNVRSHLTAIDVQAVSNATEYHGIAYVVADTVMISDEASGVAYQQQIPAGFQSRASV